MRPKKLAHVVLRTARLAEMADWYIRLLDAEVAYRDQRCCFMTYDEEHHRLGLIQVEGLQPRSDATCGMEHFAFTYGGLADLVAIYAALKARGIVPFYAVNHGVTMSFYYRDPDANRIELLSENFASAAVANDFVRSGPYQSNPRGIPVDPEKLAAGLRAGVPVDELIQFRELA